MEFIDLKKRDICAKSKSDIKIEHIETCGFAAATRGMRNALNSWHMSDSIRDKIGHNDRKLMIKLLLAGNSHRKYLRMMHIQMDVTAPLYWWKDYDTYKVATVANSCSTMHKIHDKKFEIDQFVYSDLDASGLRTLKYTIAELNACRDRYLESGNKDKQAWKSMIKLLPTSYLQKRTLDINYETAISIILDRRNHKLQEFRDLCDVMYKCLPLMKTFIDAIDDDKKTKSNVKSVRETENTIQLDLVKAVNDLVYDSFSNVRVRWSINSGFFEAIFCYRFNNIVKYNTQKINLESLYNGKTDISTIINVLYNRVDKFICES